MDRATEYGEPIAYDAADRMEAAGISPLEAGRKLVAVGLSRVRAAIDDKPSSIFFFFFFGFASASCYLRFPAGLAHDPGREAPEHAQFNSHRRIEGTGDRIDLKDIVGARPRASAAGDDRVQAEEVPDQPLG